MKITIQQRQSDGTNKKIVFKGGIVKTEGFVFQDDSERNSLLLSFLAKMEMELNKSSVGIWLESEFAFHV